MRKRAGEMSLDLTKVAGQVIAMISGLKNARQERQQHLQFALDTLSDRAIDIDELKKKIASSRTTWLVAELTEGLDRRYPPSPVPSDFTVIGSDGSHIDVDDGKIIGSENMELDIPVDSENDEILSHFIKTYYTASNIVPLNVLISHNIEDTESIENYLSNIRNAPVHIKQPAKGEKRKLLDCEHPRSAA